MPLSLPTLIVAANQDPASRNIADKLIQKYNFKPASTNTTRHQLYQQGGVQLAIIDKECIYAEPGELPPTSSIIFASKHRSSTGTPALTAHATGNLTKEALYGGNPEEVSFVEPYRIQAALSTLRHRTEEEGVKIEVTLEATHHGPTSFPVSACFVEIGSGPEEWASPALGQIAAEACMAAAMKDSQTAANAVGIGGTHYPAKHTRLCLNGEYLIGHIVSRHALDAEPVDNVIRDLFAKTLGGCKTAVVDWKGLTGEQRRRIVEKLAAWNIEVVKA